MLFNRTPLFTLALFIGIPINAWLLLASYWSVNPLIYPLAVLFGLIAWQKPRYAIYLFLVMLPLFGNRPSQVQTHYLIVFNGVLLIALYSKLLLLPMAKKRFMVRFLHRDLGVMFIFFWLIASLFSLIGLPLAGAFKHTFEESFLYPLSELLRVGETTLYSSVQSVFFSFQAVMLGMYLYGTMPIHSRTEHFKKLFLALLLGLLISIIIGHLDYFGLLSLEGWRITQQHSSMRLLSFFGNSTWYAQYLALSLPLLPTLLLLPAITQKRHWVMFLGMVGFLIIGEITLILAMQRGAWVSYPPTLFLIWVAIYYTFATLKTPSITLMDFLKKTWFKILVTVPLSVVISIMSVYAIKDYRKHNTAITIQNSFEATKERAKKLAKSDDRLKHWPPAMLLFAENPIFGGGGDSFGWQYKVYFESRDGKYNNHPAHTLKKYEWGTSHNMYLQNLTGRGIFGLLFLLAFLGIVVLRLTTLLFNQTSKDLPTQLLALSSLGSLVATLIYANVQEIFYNQSTQILFWVVLFIGIGLTHKERLRPLQKQHYQTSAKYLLLLMIALLPLHVVNISFVKEYLITHLIPWFGFHEGANLFDTLFWIILSITLISSAIHLFIINHSHKEGLFIDCTGAGRIQQFHTTPTPRVGGIGLMFANLFLLFNPLGPAFILSAIPAFIGGILDDFNNLSARERLIFQSISALFAISLLDAYIIDFHLFTLPYIMAVILFTFGIVGVTNAINIIDGFNGLASGVALMILSALGYVAFTHDDMVLFEIIVINFAALVGFLLLNFPKGKIFLGDGGAFLVGFTLATLSILVVARHPEISILYPLTLLIYPIFEVLFSIYRKVFIKKTSPFRPDPFHFHMLIFKRRTRNNPKTALFIWKIYAPFVLLSTLVAHHSVALLGMILLFIGWYLFTYRRIVKGLMP